MASKRRIRRKECHGKIKHSSLENAVMAVGIAKRQGWGNMFAYHCRFCNCYHIGHPSKEIRRAMRTKLESKP